MCTHFLFLFVSIETVFVFVPGYLFRPTVNPVWEIREGRVLRSLNRFLFRSSQKRDTIGSALGVSRLEKCSLSERKIESSVIFPRLRGRFERHWLYVWCSMQIRTKKTRLRVRSKGRVRPDTYVRYGFRNDYCRFAFNIKIVRR